MRLTGEGEVIYLQQRGARGGASFGLYKFATMLKNSPILGTGTITVKGTRACCRWGTPAQDQAERAAAVAQHPQGRHEHYRSTPADSTVLRCLPSTFAGGNCQGEAGTVWDRLHHLPR